MQSTLDRISEWMSRQSWYLPNGDARPRLRELAEIFLPSADPTARVRVLVVADDARDDGMLYQVPVVERDVAPDPSDPRWIGRGYGGAALFDGVGDTAYAAALLAGMHEAGTLIDPDDDRFVVRCEAVQDAGPRARLSVQVYGRPEIDVTVYRQLLPGPHPDAAAAEQLTDAAVRPRLVGTLRATWTEDDDWVETAHLALAEQTETGSIDGWTHLIGAARAGRDVRDDVRAMGAAVARMHAGLRDTARPLVAAERERTLAAWRTRLLAASHRIPDVAMLAPAAQRLLDDAEDAAWPALQSVHGSLELTALRRTPDGEWRIADHGGAAPVPADDRADLPGRDIAAVLRSIDYAAGLAQAGDGWAAEVRQSFLEGAGVAEDDALVRAMQLDLGLFDAVSEQRMRPEHLHIPLGTIAVAVGAVTVGDELTAA
ncbi:hypothetical protein [Schumannella sp. 10F1B-5-1]|uniref:maltokinase N-terminal cap-like domain-containing protein n=1 Tax=Schumannella sp. 10F1B-5-1 TaxID=2590780 RepID=UPI0011324449|nr:hypothetical protein [Schumannella sp. 10F1B-5-1]TPW70765.1 hypothetical protein FJ658_11585 [Schumannella sp. 10F1B-5-1]